ncbi:hypothetical protein DL96DRAFT_897906 [Flagelloscypha sp. PMI_526]|nr:hypothetical protein DL96DRAFT_897906 [Flagelloscypha sp. PMI_526]
MRFYAFLRHLWRSNEWLSLWTQLLGTSQVCHLYSFLYSATSPNDLAAPSLLTATSTNAPPYPSPDSGLSLIVQAFLVAPLSLDDLEVQFDCSPTCRHFGCLRPEDETNLSQDDWTRRSEQCLRRCS